MELGIIDNANYSSGLDDNYLSLIMFNQSFGSMNFDNYLSRATVGENSSITGHLRSLIEEEDEFLLQDLDPQWNEKAPNNDKPEQRSKSLFDDDDADSDLDLDGWIYKPKIEWKKTDTINWLLWAGTKLGHSYGSMSPQLALSGKDLLSLSKDDFCKYDQYFGEQLHDLLHRKRGFKSHRLSCESSKSIVNQSTLPASSDERAGEVSASCSSDSSKQQRPGNKRPRLWRFVRHLLLDPEFCPEWIRWENYDNKTFRFVQNENVAKLWGQLNNKPNMTYKKFTRAIRHYYRKPDGEDGAIFVPVQERLVYKFGDTVKGLETDNPNFDPGYWTNRNMENLSLED